MPESSELTTRPEIGEHAGLADGLCAKRRPCSHDRAAVVARFERFLAATGFQPVRLPAICVAIGVSERTLRTCCHEQLGMSPTHYVWLRRMHLAYSALLGADPARASVTEIATHFGFWELGRFSVEYRELFGESPSTSLHRSVRT
ncbi:MAG: AraC family transcriptional regulator [Alphaproteobacteria bacterium]|nr:AraC family transcriptional regulator [Alphaproteobacteria bacterium]